MTDVVAAINDVFQTSDVLAAEETTTTSGDLTYTTNASAQTVSLNGVDIQVGALATQAEVISAINSASDATGVTASNNGGAIVLTADGRDIELVDGATNGGANLLGGDEDFFAGIVFSGDVGATITLAGTFTNTAGTAGLATIDNTFADEVLNGVNVLTATSSNDALRTVDFALSQVSNLRSEFGAIQNRLESTITNCRSHPKTSPPRGHASSMPTSRRRRPASRARRSCSRRVYPRWRRRTPCRSWSSASWDNSIDRDIDRIVLEMSGPQALPEFR